MGSTKWIATHDCPLLRAEHPGFPELAPARLQRPNRSPSFLGGGSCTHLAMGQNPNRSPSEHPKPTTKIGTLKWVVNSPIPTKMGSKPFNGLDHHSHLVKEKTVPSPPALSF